MNKHAHKRTGFSVSIEDTRKDPCGRKYYKVVIFNFDTYYKFFYNEDMAILHAKTFIDKEV